MLCGSEDVLLFFDEQSFFMAKAQSAAVDRGRSRQPRRSWRRRRRIAALAAAMDMAWWPSPATEDTVVRRVGYGRAELTSSSARQRSDEVKMLPLLYPYENNITGGEEVCRRRLLAEVLQKCYHLL